jgi:ArsR family transcriptional regulator, lead/cadmium/zinc/bismuth-responsive transcriptional repressor
MKPRDSICSDPIASLTGKPPIHERPLLTADQATEIVVLFQVLGNDSRLRMLHALTHAGEVCVGDLATAVEMTPQAVSNQLRRLVDRRIVAARRDGNRILYRIIDPCVPGLLELGLCLAEETGRVCGDAEAKSLVRAESSTASRSRTSRERASRRSKKG